MSQRTFSIIKPDAVRKGYTGAILAEIEKAGFKLVSIKKISLSKAQAEGFYHVHAARPFFGSLTDFMSNGPIFPMVLEKDNAIADLRKLMGATNPANAEEGTIRKQFAGPSKRMRFTGRTRKIRQPLRSAISLPVWNCSSQQRCRVREAPPLRNASLSASDQLLTPPTSSCR